MPKKSEWYAQLKDRVNDARLSRWIGQQLTLVSRGRAEVTLSFDKKHLQRQGQLHGGWYGFIADTAGFFAVMSLCSPDDGATTIEYKVNLLAPAVPENAPVVAKARVVKKSGSIAVAQMEILDGRGEICASGVGTYRIFRGKGAPLTGK